MMNNIFAGIKTDSEVEIFDTLLKHEDVHIERIISNGQITPEGEWYDQVKNEWVLILKGAAKIKYENESIIELVEGDYIDIPAHQKHRVEWTAMDTLWLAIHY